MACLRGIGSGWSLATACAPTTRIAVYDAPAAVMMNVIRAAIIQNECITLCSYLWLEVVRRRRDSGQVLNGRHSSEKRPRDGCHDTEASGTMGPMKSNADSDPGEQSGWNFKATTAWFTLRTCTTWSAVGSEPRISLRRSSQEHSKAASRTVVRTL